jgi:predicted secreted protein
MLPPESTTGSGNSAELASAPAASSGLAVAQCRDWLQWAAAQVDACVAGDKLAMNEVLASLTDLMGSAPRAAAAAPHEPAAQKLSAVIMAVQAHDRVMQGLVHVAEALGTLQAQLGNAQQVDSADSWRKLREQQFRAFSMAEERLLFARLVAHEDEDEAWRKAGRIPVEAVAVELFTSDDGLFES